MPETTSSLLDAALIRWLIERASGGIFTTDADLIIRSWNSWLSRLTGQTAESVIGRRLFDVRPELVRRGLDRYYEIALRGQSSMLAHRFHGYLLKIAMAAGDMPQSCRIAPLLHDEGIIGTVTVIEDVSERVNTERELRRQIAAAEHARADSESALRAKDEFLATLSHELRTPLNAVLGWTNILLNDKPDDAMRERALHVIERNAAAQARLIDDMLDMARIVTGKIRLELSVVDAVAATSAAIDVVRPAASAKRISIHTDFSCGPKLIQADGARFQQVVWNVLSNAVKFTPAGGRIDLRVDEQRDGVNIVVTDSGKGIPAEFLPFVFDRFRQGHSSMTRSEGGLGLGLALVRQLVDLHGGSVRVTSDGIDRGSTFTITFPSMGIDTRPRPADGRARLEPDALAAHCILIVDDDQDWSEVLCMTLQSLGAQVLAAATAHEAIALLAAPDSPMPTALVINVGVPQQDGSALLRQIRVQGGPVESAPAIAITAYAGSEHEREARASGFDGFCSKPVTPENVAVTILDVTRRGRGTSELPRPR